MRFLLQVRVLVLQKLPEHQWPRFPEPDTKWVVVLCARWNACSWALQASTHDTCTPAVRSQCMQTPPYHTLFMAHISLMPPQPINCCFFIAVDCTCWHLNGSQCNQNHAHLGLRVLFTTHISLMPPQPINCHCSILIDWLRQKGISGSCGSWNG
jgi:hypothetical protein